MPATSDKIPCPVCEELNLPGTLFCVRCGTYLSSGGPLRTEPLPLEDTPPPASPYFSRTPVDQEDVLGIEVEVTTTGRKVLLAVDREILVGRLDATQGVFPELDLTSEGALEHGVSRRHARIYTQGGVCYVEDLSSSNHTLLNGERLESYVPYAFVDNDELTFGTLKVRIHIYQ